jgi:preprotein translocase subunit SecE
VAEKTKATSIKSNLPVKKAAAPVAKEKKVGGIQRWWRETIGELRKVHWPTPKEAWRLTRIVIVVVVIMGVLLGGLDYVFTIVIGKLLGSS